MQIQRIQSVYLFVAAVLMALVCFVAPIAVINTTDASITQYITSLPQLLILNLLAAVLLFINIFLFKNLVLQMKVTRIAIVLAIASALIEAYVLCTLPAEVAPQWWQSMTMLVAALVFSFLALKGMKHDKKLLSSYDRLR